jgi:hypothetical protein
MKDDPNWTSILSYPVSLALVIGLLGITELQEDEFRCDGVIQYK